MKYNFILFFPLFLFLFYARSFDPRVLPRFWPRKELIFLDRKIIVPNRLVFSLRTEVQAERNLSEIWQNCFLSSPSSHSPFLSSSSSSFTTTSTSTLALALSLFSLTSCRLMQRKKRRRRRGRTDV